MFRTYSITQRLFLSFGILVINIVVITALALYFLNRSNEANRLGEQFANQRLQILELISTDLDFLRFETLNVNYYRTHQSQLLLKRKHLLIEIQHTQKTLAIDMKSWRFPEAQNLETIDDGLRLYDSTFSILLDKIIIRGFKDFGLEGSMRDQAHDLEQEPSIHLSDVLTLRRHEKDFLLRKEKQYIDKFNDLSNELIAKLERANKHSAAGVLSAYEREFNKLTAITFEIGITPQVGYLGLLNSQTTAIFERLTKLDDAVKQRKSEILSDSAFWFIGISIALIFSSCVLTFFTSTRLARPIKKLSQSMGKFMVNEGLKEKEVEETLTNDEISMLSTSFIKMSRKLKSQFNEIIKQNSELKTLNEELDRFIYSAAHDLKSPLASLDGLVHLADREIDSPAHRHYFQMMSASLRKLNGFINDITDYAKNKRQALVIERVELETIINDIIESLKFLPQAQNMEVSVKISGTEFYTDKTRLEIILKNLIANSFRYHDSTKAISKIKIEGTVTETNLRLSIEDNGIGIGRQHLGKIFQMFYRAVEHSKGTGIGLFLVKESVKMLRGKIAVKSSLGEWTVFYLTITNFKLGHENAPESNDVVQTEHAELFS